MRTFVLTLASNISSIDPITWRDTMEELHNAIGKINTIEFDKESPAIEVDQCISEDKKQILSDLAKQRGMNIVFIETLKEPTYANAFTARLIDNTLV